MADVRTTISGIGGKFPSRVPGTATGMQLNTFGIQKLRAAIRGDMLVPILLKNIEPAREKAFADWPRITGASGDSIRTEVEDIGPHYARVSLKVGGQPLIEDPRNKSHKDYAPFIEFNGTTTTHPGTLLNAMLSSEDEMKQGIREDLAELMNNGS